MKILSKGKDYYDYLTGIYGIDEKLVLDRRNSDARYNPEYLRFYIAGYIIEGIYQDKQFYYGEKLKELEYDKSIKKIWLSRHNKRDYYKSIEIKYGSEGYKKLDWIYLEPVKDSENINQKENCPVLLKYWNKYHKFPYLKEYDLQKFIPAETIYQWLSEWLGNQITLKEKSPELSNDNKIESKGFDKKRSFRNKMK